MRKIKIILLFYIVHFFITGIKAQTSKVDSLFNKKLVLISIDSIGFISKDYIFVEFIPFKNFKKESFRFT
jgi:hypothetical protein